MLPTRIVALAKRIETNTSKLDQYFSQNAIPPPSFEEDAPMMYMLPADLLGAQEALSEAMEELWWLVQGPIQTIMAKSLTPSVGLHFILKYDIHKLVPLDIGTTFSDLAAKTGIPEQKLIRLLRFAMTDRLFREDPLHHVKHTIATKALVKVPFLDAWACMGVYDISPAKMHLIDAIAKWPQSEEPQNAGFNIAFSTDKTMFEFFQDRPEHVSRFKDAMSLLQTSPGMENSYVVRGFDWASLGKATVVDVGGSSGHVSMALAEEYPDLRFVVQDLSTVVESARPSMVPAEIFARVEFETHNFFDEQPRKNADVYYFRLIMHDWSDKYCIKILQATLPALKSGSRLLFSERCLEPPCTLPMRKERWNRESDITMMSTTNAEERDQEGWKRLFLAVSSELVLEEVRRFDGSKLDLIIARWKG